MMFENIEELLKNTDCRLVNDTGERWLCYTEAIKEIGIEQEKCHAWVVSERQRYAKKTKQLYLGDDLREAMQFMK